MVIQGSALLKDLKSDFNLPFEESPDYHTLAGFVLAKPRHVPEPAKTQYNGYRLTIMIWRKAVVEDFERTGK